jgi:hypothetical protein
MHFQKELNLAIVKFQNLLKDMIKQQTKEIHEQYDYTELLKKDDHQIMKSLMSQMLITNQEESQKTEICAEKSI